MTVTIKIRPVNSRRFYRAVSDLKRAGAVYDASGKTWTLNATEWYQFRDNSDVEALTETPVHVGGGDWVMESTGRIVDREDL